MSGCTVCERIVRGGPFSVEMGFISVPNDVCTCVHMDFFCKVPPIFAVNGAFLVQSSQRP